MYDKFKRHLLKNTFFSVHDRVLVAVSGGQDSIALLHLLKVFSLDYPIDITVVHVNHRLRPSSDAEADFVRALTSQLSLPYHEEVWHHQKISLGVEEKARIFRYNVFRRLMVDYDKLVTAHHADDQAETLLMRLIRGNRLSNLSGISPRRPFATGELIRPLLPFTKFELSQLELTFVEDESNQSPNYFRNRVRNQYLPLLSKENPQLTHDIVQLSEELVSANELIYHHISKLKETLQSNGRVDLSMFQKISNSERYFFILDYFEQNDIFDLSKNRVQEILSLLSNSKQYQYKLSEQKQLVKTYDTFWIEWLDCQNTQILEVILNEKGFENDCISFSWQPRPNDSFIPLYSMKPVTIRSRKAGDKLQLSPSLTKKVRRLLIDDKVPIDEREKSIILEQNDKIIAVLTKNKTYLSISPETDTIKNNLYFKWKG
ncbi:MULTISPECIES: tRNA lysidine(34) synthetase TilS [unclassified Enterococcus]|uniref:tRNA lysidine(34) synthetase TilS n=1 Tax=unclassified Enterococcus TaxID=2608891 RepID=UPI001556C498|nr:MULTISPECIES: tRNA lysidine(34) synthetase TilS [unclassified Enterococcus]MBS7578278.1 tRNA lysidine(34) synthetase TilS [Enterococcus sp. MMGLQ5-2]MBS7585458.1 tRNA lysidine(34) synthetase TilS [Enterococcus sp. MMGLQ5-1]NPD13315.1 tRNA lysidine(34) synthetase TilS [Enterococcus sp. MMGLQ5-1]NPD38109.1 tRNA lysidine(34) synthetase TilS [Enterococcus sp. MMGLQ5-2]